MRAWRSATAATPSARASRVAGRLSRSDSREYQRNEVVGRHHGLAPFRIELGGGRGRLYLLEGGAFRLLRAHAVANRGHHGAVLLQRGPIAERPVAGDDPGAIV